MGQAQPHLICNMVCIGITECNRLSRSKKNTLEGLLDHHHHHLFIQNQLYSTHHLKFISGCICSRDSVSKSSHEFPFTLSIELISLMLNQPIYNYLVDHLGVRTAMLCSHGVAGLR